MTIQADFTEVVEHIRQARQKAYAQIKLHEITEMLESQNDEKIDRSKINEL